MADVIDVPTSPSAGTPVETTPGGSPLLWNRWWNLVVGTASGETISLAPFHVQFSVDMIANQTPWMMEATIINVPPDLAQAIVARYTNVALAGGYQQVQRGDLFNGQITYFESGKLTPTETFLRIHAATMDTALSQALINQTLPEGHTMTDVVKACVAAMPGATLGYVSPLATNQSPRGRTLFGQPKDVLRDVAQSANAMVWCDGNGKVNVVTPDDAGYQPDTIPINMGNGLVSIPTQQLGAGLSVRCLLNYKIVPGVKIRLNQQDINQVIASSGDNPLVNQQWGLQTTAPITWNGIYQAYNVRHTGDSRGTNWYTDITTRPIDPDQQAPAIAA